MDKIVKIKLNNGNTIKYKVRNGMYFHASTDENICFDILEANTYHERLKIWLGDVKTGKAWGDVETGYIGKSTGEIKIPLVVYNTRSFGGGALLDHCIVKIEYANKRNARNGEVTKYEHSNFSI